MGVKQVLFRALRGGRGGGEQLLPGLYGAHSRLNFARRGDSWSSSGYTCPWVEAPMHSPEVACRESAVSKGECFPVWQTQQLPPLTS